MWIVIDLDSVCFNAIDRLIRCSIGDYSIKPYEPETRVSEIAGIHTIHGEYDWDKVFSDEEIVKDSIIVNAPAYTRSISAYYNIVYLTSRPDSCRMGTLESLVKNGFAEGLLWMRKHGDWRPSSVIKAELIRENEYRLNAPIVAAVDDDYDGGLKEMYDSLGITHFYTLKDLLDFIKERVSLDIHKSDK